MRVQRLTAGTIPVLIAALSCCAPSAGAPAASSVHSLSVNFTLMDGAAVRQSGQLAAAPDLASGGGRELSGADGAALAADLATRIPVPSGGNLNGIEWGDLDGTIAAALAQSVVEYNAACQWYRALRDGRQAADARRVIADIPAWQGTRGRETGELAAAVAADVAAGGGEALSGVLRQCDASHVREVAYATAHGRPGEW